MNAPGAIVRAEPRHAAVLAELHAGGFPAPWNAHAFEVFLQQPGVAGWIQTVGLHSGPEPYGFILVRSVADEAEILTLAVNPSQRRRRIASQLLDTACRTLAAGGVLRLFLEVAADNTAALALYAGHGFAPCGRRPDYYRTGATDNGTDAVVMRLDLEPGHAKV